MVKATKIFKGFHSLGLWKAKSAFSPRQLTVLNYHRIDDPEGERAYFRPNISATPKSFGEQMDYLNQNYSVVSLGEIGDWLAGKGKLPPRAALITFDDGYRDNYLNAYPELKRRNLPAVIFLASGFIDNSRPFYWDLLAFAFQQTNKDFFSELSLREFSWSGGKEKENVVHRVVEFLKTLPDEKKDRMLDHIIEDLDVAIPSGEFSSMFLTWDKVREMADNGIEMGAHTVNHPILTRISPQEAKKELWESKQQIQAEVGREVRAFAYPNGQENDFSKGTEELLGDAGYDMAFTLLPGPISHKTLKSKPLSIRRIFLSHRDDLPRFAAKLNGVPKVMELLGRGM